MAAAVKNMKLAGAGAILSVTGILAPIGYVIFVVCILTWLRNLGKFVVLQIGAVKSINNQDKAAEALNKAIGDSSNFHPNYSLN